MTSPMTSFSIKFGNLSSLNILLVDDLRGILTVGIPDGGLIYPKGLPDDGLIYPKGLPDGGLIYSKGLTEPDSGAVACGGAEDR